VFDSGKLQGPLSPLAANRARNRTGNRTRILTRVDSPLAGLATYLSDFSRSRLSFT
jgi:hypothetical protein